MTALEPLRAAALAQADAEARAVAEGARALAAARLADAEAQAAAELARRRTAAEAAARVRGERARAQARRAAREVLLGARRDAYEALRRRAGAELGALGGRPEYAAMVERLARDARVRLAGAAVEPAPGGGIVARAGTRRLDYSLPAQLERCLAALELEELWR